MGRIPVGETAVKIRLTLYRETHICVHSGKVKFQKTTKKCGEVSKKKNIEKTRNVKTGRLYDKIFPSSQNMFLFLSCSPSVFSFTR